MVGSDEVKEVIAITVGSYPFGEAATNRHLAYLRGLSEKGISVKLLLLAPGNHQSKKSNLKRVEYHGVKIKYLSPVLFTNNKIFKFLNFLCGAFFGFFCIIRRIQPKQNKKILILLITSPVILLPYILTGKIFGYKIVHERTEYPFIGNRNKFLLNIYLKNIIPKFDGLFVISYALKEYFKKFTKRSIFVLPMSVESDRFSDNKELSNDRYIAYCGSMYNDKDGVPDLIKSFNILAKKHDFVKLVLIGDNSDNQKFKIISDAISSSPYKDRIECTGLIERDYIPKLLINAEILALARPDSLQAKGGFPTKLGEYLSTGNPVVITDVGEHSIYLKDEVSACIVPPNNSTEFANKISYLLDNPVRAKEIGKNGKIVAYLHFDYLNQSDALLCFFNEI